MGVNWWEFNIGSGNGLVPSGIKPLPEPVLTKIHDAIMGLLASVRTCFFILSWLAYQGLMCQYIMRNKETFDNELKNLKTF